MRLCRRGRRSGSGSWCGGDPFKLLRDVVRGLPAVGRILGQTGSNDVVQRWRRHGLQRSHRLRLGVHDRGDQAGLTLGLECLLAGDHLVNHRAKSKDVRAGVRVLTIQLLGALIRFS